jgi:hypothetical protein
MTLTAMMLPLLVLGLLLASPCMHHRYDDRMGHFRAAVRLSMTGADQKALIQVIHAAIGHNRLTRRAIPRHLRLKLLLRILLLVILVEFFGHFVNETLVMFGMLQIAFGQNAVTRRRGIPRQSHIFFVDLVSRAANAHIGTIAVERLNPWINATPTVLAVVVMMPATAVTPAMPAAVSTATHASRVVVMSHELSFLRYDLYFLCPKSEGLTLSC